MKRLLIFSCLVLLLGPRLSRAAEADGPELAGTVVDPLGARVPGAHVQVLRDDQPVAETTADASGAFLLDALRPGRYTAIARAEGFATRQVPAFFLAAGGRTSIEVRLEVGPLEQHVFVTASVGAVPASQAGASASVVDAETLQALGYVDVLDALRTIPGVQVVQSGGRGGTAALFVRGGNANFNKILLDGVPANDIGGAFEFADLSTTGVERVEVLRGSNSVRFGSDALTGVVSVETRRGRSRTPEATVLVEGGRFGTGRADLSVGGAVNRLDYFAEFDHFRTDNQVENADYKASTFAGRAGVTLGTRTRIGGTLRRLDTKAGNPNAVNYFGISDDARIGRGGTYGSITAESQVSDRWQAQVRFGSAVQRYEYANPTPTGDAFDPFGFGANYLGRTVTIRGASGYAVTGRAILDYGGAYPSTFTSRTARHLLSGETTYEPVGNFLVAGGVRFEHEHGESVSGAISQTHRTNYGAFTEVRASAIDRLFVTGGVGVDRNEIFGTAATPRVSAAVYVRRPSVTGAFGDTKVTFNAGDGIKEPSLFQELSSLYALVPASAPVRAGLSPVGPERTRSVDAGVEQGLSGGRARLRVAAFTNTFSDLLEYVSKSVLPQLGVSPAAAAATPFGAYVNSQSYRARGIEVSGEAAVGVIRVSGSYMFLDASVTRSLSSGALTPAVNPLFPGIPIGAYSPLVGARPFRRPAHSGSLTAGYSGPRANVLVAAYFLGKQDDSTFLTDEYFGTSLLLPNAGLDRAYQRADISGSYRVHSRVRWFLTIENVFDESYEAVAGYPALPRSARTGLAITIGGDRRP